MKNFTGKQIRAVLLVVVSLFLLAVNGAAQSDKEVAAVRSEVASINGKAAKYTVRTKNLTDLSLEGAEATYYLSDQRIKKITAKLYGETYNAAAEVYYRGDKPIFIFRRQNKYDVPVGSSKKSKVVGSEEQRIYFNDAEVLKIMIGKTVLETTDARYGEIDKSLTALAQTLWKSYTE